jgi:hypothetical protein
MANSKIVEVKLVIREYFFLRKFNPRKFHQV